MGVGAAGDGPAGLDQACGVAETDLGVGLDEGDDVAAGLAGEAVPAAGHPPGDVHGETGVVPARAGRGRDGTVEGSGRAIRRALQVRGRGR